MYSVSKEYKYNIVDYKSVGKMFYDTLVDACLPATNTVEPGWLKLWELELPDNSI